MQISGLTWHGRVILPGVAWNGIALVIPQDATEHVVTSGTSGTWGCGAWYNTECSKFNVMIQHNHSKLQQKN